MTASPNRCTYCGSPTTTAGHHIPTPPASVFTAEQWVRGLGFFGGLLLAYCKRPGEAVASTERLTLDLGAAMGVPLPTRQDRVAILPNGTKVQTKLLPPGSVSIPANLDREAV